MRDPLSGTPPPPSPPLPIASLAGGAFGAVAAALALLVVYATLPHVVSGLGVVPEMIRGVHPTEFEAGGLPFAWTSDRVVFVFDGLDRSNAWTLQLRAKAGRGPGLPPPTVTFDVNGAPQGSTSVGAGWQDVRAAVPADTSARRPRATRVTMQVAPTFVPGPGDTRTLGLVLGEVRLVPEGVPVAPRRALVAVAIAGAILGALMTAIGVPLPWALGLTAVFAIAQALAVSAGAGPYTRGYLDAIPRLAGGAALPVAAATAGATLIRRRALPPAAAAAFAIAAIGFVLVLEGLLHPAKTVVDALFHAHRFQWVAAGRYFFTQPMPSGVEFPYAIGLYVAALPWAELTRNHVLLLRLVVVAAHALAALALYPLVARGWDDRRVAVTAVAAYLLLPLPFIVIGNANQTYAFGQSVATIALAAAMTWPLGPRRVVAILGVTALMALGLLSHVGLIPLLGGLVGLSAALVAWRGEDRRAGWIVLAAAAVATLLAIGLYYRHFGDAFRSAQRVQAAGAAAVPATETEQRGAADVRPPPAGTSRAQRALRAGRLAVDAYGAPLLLLAAAGLWGFAIGGARDRTSLLVIASLVVCALVGGVSVLAPVEPRFERYTDEFISRLYYAVAPAVVLLASRGLIGLWSLGRANRVAAVLLAAAAVLVTARTWLGWIR